jgi:group I intron endonuclease
MCGIYKITNNINGKVYIGQSIAIQKRFNRHKTTAYNINDEAYNYPLYQAIRKYGENNFSFEVIEECDLDLLDSREKYWIQFFKSDNRNFGYNQTPGGDSSFKNLKITWDIADKIVYLLRDTELSQEEIAEKFNVSQSMVSYICSGISWRKEGIKYPIREKSSQRGNIVKKYCLNCGKEMDSKSIAKYCMSCKQEEFEKTHPSREELKFLIRNKTFVEIGKMYNVSDNSVKKWCDKYNLPRLKKEIKSYSDEKWLSL